jgi:hypothetical protein
MPNGTFTASQLTAATMKINEIKNLDRAIKRQYDYNPAVFNAMRSNQMAKLSVLEDPVKDRDLRIVWFEQTKTGVTQSCIKECSFTGVEGGTYAKDYSLDACVSKPIKLSEKRQRTNMITWEEEFAQLMLQADWEIAMDQNTKALAFLEANLGNSVYAPQGWTNNDDGIVVPNASYNKSLGAKLHRSAILNKLGNRPLTITGGEMFDYFYDYEKESANADGKDSIAKLKAAGEWVFDIEGMGDFTDQRIYQVSPFSYAHASKVDSEFTATPRLVAGDLYNYSYPSKFMPGVVYQVKHYITCEDAQFRVDNIALELKSKFFLNPTSVNAPTGSTGIVKWYLDEEGGE